ncbi:MAG: hypothetical protein V4608_08665 [Bacteroidota bacterium]
MRTTSFLSERQIKWILLMARLPEKVSGAFYPEINLTGFKNLSGCALSQ